jgi:uncharacterized phage-like protein YoqJ
LIAAQVVLTYNRIFPKFSIWLTCIIPGRDRDKNFTDEEKELYQLIRDRADVIHTMTRGTTTQEIIHKSNMCMIDNTDQLLSYWNGHKSHSSVFSTINYADKLDKPITIVNPFNTAMRYDYRDVMTDTLPAESNIKHVLESAT